MKLDTSIINYILDVVKTAKAVGLDGVVIEPGRVRGNDENNTRIILHTADIPALPFGSIAINRIDLFLNRYELARSMPGFTVEATTLGEISTAEIKEDPRAMFVNALQLKAKGLKLDFKCSHPLVCKAPRNLKDKMKYQFQMTPEAYTFMDKGKRAFGTDEVIFRIEDEVLIMELIDINNDKLRYELESSVERVDDDDDSDIRFNNKFDLETLMTMFKASPSAPFNVSDRTGYIKMRVNNLDVCIFPKV